MSLNGKRNPYTGEIELTQEKEIQHIKEVQTGKISYSDKASASEINEGQVDDKYISPINLAGSQACFLFKYNTKTDFPSTGNDSFIYFSKDTSQYYVYENDKYKNILNPLGVGKDNIIKYYDKSDDDKNNLNIKIPTLEDIIGGNSYTWYFKDKWDDASTTRTLNDALGLIGTTEIIQGNHIGSITYKENDVSKSLLFSNTKEFQVLYFRIDSKIGFRIFNNAWSNIQYIVNAEQGKGLSSNDLTDSLLALINGAIQQSNIVDDLNTDNNTKVLSARQGKILNEKLIASNNPTKEYADITARDNDKANITNGQNVLVKDASDDSNVASGWAIYKYIIIGGVGKFYLISKGSGSTIDFSLYFKKENIINSLTDGGTTKVVNAEKIKELNTQVETNKTNIETKVIKTFNAVLFNVNSYNERNYYKSNGDLDRKEFIKPDGKKITITNTYKSNGDLDKKVLHSTDFAFTITRTNVYDANGNLTQKNFTSTGTIDNSKL